MVSDKQHSKVRIDSLLVEKGFASDLKCARSLLLSGSVLVDNKPITKSGQLVSIESSIRLKGAVHPYVGRGGMKLESAIDSFAIPIKGKICMDVGASTGGFTDVLLKNGARKVYAIDVGYGQLDWSLRKDERVVVLDRTNIRKLDPNLIADQIDVAVVDVSFISLKLVLPVLDGYLKKKGEVIALIKPQFEVDRDKVGKGGIVRDEAAIEQVLVDIKGVGKNLNWKCVGVIPSPILGAKGNREYLIYFLKIRG